MAIASLACLGGVFTGTAGAAGFSHAPGSPFAARGATGALALGDLNGDGFNDAVATDPAGGRLVMLTGNTEGQLAPAGGPAVPKPSAVAIADLNLDGRQDVVAANEDSRSVTVLLGDGAGSLTAAAKSPFRTDEPRPVTVVVGDFKKDGKPDVAVVNESAANVAVMVGDGLGGLARGPGSPVSTSGSHPGPAAAGDFTGDGRLDLAVANESGNVVVLKGDGTGRLSRAGASPFGPTPAAIGAGEFNGDGRLDVAVANTGGTVTVLLGDETGGLSRRPGSIPAGSGPAALAVADLDFDGRLDLAVANAGSGDVSVMLGDGAGGFAPMAGTPVPTGGAAPSALASGEMNGDGKPDLVVVNGGSASVAVLLNAVPSAAFVSFPASPAVGQTVTFAYSSVEPLVSLDWDLDGNGIFDDAHGPTAARAFAAPGVYQVRLRVVDLDGATATGTRTIVVGAGVAPALGPVGPAYPAVIRPFPIVRVAGRTARRGARIRKLAVYAPPGVKATVRCRGKSCPFRAWRRTVGLKTLSVKPLRGRFLRAGVTLEVRVSKSNMIGKYTKLLIRRHKEPARTDLCLAGRASRPIPCPVS